MVSARQKHIVLPLRRWQKVQTKVSTPDLRVRELRMLKEEAIVLIKTPLSVDCKNYLREEITQSEALQKRLSQEYLKRLITYEEQLTLEQRSRDPMFDTLPMGSFAKHNDPMEHPIFIKFYHLRRLLAFSLYEGEPAKDRWFFWQFELKETEEIVDTVLRTNPTFVQWQEERRQNFERNLLLLSIERLDQEYYPDKINDYGTLGELKTDVQRVSTYFTRTLKAVLDLSLVKIQKIFYEYNAEKKRLKLYINGNHELFSGDSAVILKQILEAPYDEIEYEDFNDNSSIAVLSADKAIYDRYYRKFEKINVRIALSEKLMKYGVLDFVLSEGYSAKLNPSYADFIQQPNSIISI